MSLPCISWWSWSSHFASEEPSEWVIYLDLRGDIAMISCFRNCHGTVLLLRNEYITSLRFAVGTIIGPIGVRVASELIIAVSAAAAANMQSDVGCGFGIQKNTFGRGEVAGEQAEIVSAKCSECE